jgi:hypothetical protein
MRLFDFENDFTKKGDMDWLFLVAVNFVVYLALCSACILGIISLFVIVRYHVFKTGNLSKSCLYIGRVKHSRLKGKLFTKIKK